MKKNNSVPSHVLSGPARRIFKRLTRESILRERICLFPRRALWRKGSARARHTQTSCASKASLRRTGVRSACGLVSPIADVTVKSHSGHPTRGCIPRGPSCRCRAKMAHVKQSRPDSGLGFQVKPSGRALFAWERTVKRACLQRQRMEWYRSASPIKKCPFPSDPPSTLGTGLR